MSTQDSQPPEDTSQREIERLKKYTVVDCDVHELDLDPGIYAKYLDEPYASKVKHLSRTDDPLTQNFGGSAPYDVNPQVESDTLYGLGEEDLSPLTPEGMEVFKERFNADYLIFHGHLITLTANVPDQDFAAALCSAYNDYMLEEWLDENDGYKHGIRIDPQDPQQAVEEIDRLADEKDMVSIHITTTQDLMGDPKFHPVYEAAEDHGLPIETHPGPQRNSAYRFYAGGKVQSTVEQVTLSSHQALAHIPSLIFQGVPDKFPDLNFVFLEAGISWIPWIKGRMDKTYERRNHDLSFVDKRPSEYLRDQFYFGTQPIEDVAGPANIAQIIEMIDGEDTLVYTSDFPHFDFDYPSMLTLPNMSEEVERKIFGENAMSVYDI